MRRPPGAGVARRPAQPRAVRLVVAAAGVWVLLLAVLAPAAFAQPSGGTGTTATTAGGPTTTTAPAGRGGSAGSPQTTSTSGVRLRVASQSSWVPPTGQWILRVVPEGLPAGTVLTTSVYGEVDGRIRFDQRIRGEGLGTALRPGPGPLTLGAAPALPDGSVEIAVPVARSGPAPAGGVVLTGPGVYPVVVKATSPDGRQQLASLTTFIVRLPTSDTAGPSLAVGLVVGLDGKVLPTSDGGLSVEAGDAARARTRIDELAAWPGVGLTLVPTPALLAGLEAEGSTGAASVASLSAHLAGRQVLSAPYVGLDLGAWVDAGLRDQLDTQLATGADAVSSTLGVVPDGRTAVADPTLTPAALSRLQELGLAQLVVPSDQLGELAEQPDVTFTQGFDVDAGNGELLQAVTADQQLADRLHATGDPVLDAHTALADLAILYNDRPGLSRGVALEVTPDLDPAVLTVLLSAFSERLDGTDGRPILSPVTLDDLFRTTEKVTTQVRGRSTTLVRPYRSDPPGSLGAYPAQLRNAERQVEGYRSLTEPAPGSADGYARALLLSGATDLSPEERSDTVRGVTDGIAAATAEIVAPLQQFVTLTSRSGKIPLNLENRLQIPVRVHVVLDSPKLEFPQGNVIDTVLPAASTSRLDVEVTTRASGAFPLQVAVQSPDGQLQITSTRFTVRSTAISGVGLVISIGAGLFLLVWWASHFRKVRRARRLVASDHPVLGAQGTAAAATPEAGTDTTGVDDDSTSPSPGDGSPDTTSGNGPATGPGERVGYAPAETTD